jgi:hypothetical protein
VRLDPAAGTHPLPALRARSATREGGKPGKEGRVIARDKGLRQVLADVDAGRWFDAYSDGIRNAVLAQGFAETWNVRGGASASSPQMQLRLTDAGAAQLEALRVQTLKEAEEQPFEVVDNGYTLGGPFETEEEAHAFYDAWYAERGFWVTEPCETGPERPLAGPYETHEEVLAALDAVNRGEAPPPATHRLLADRPQPLTSEERVAWESAGRLGLDAARRCVGCPWQQVCHALVLRWLFDLAQSGGWLSGSRLAESRLRGDVAFGAELAWDVLREAVRLGWVEVRPKAAVLAPRCEPVVFASYRETALLRELLGLALRPTTWRRSTRTEGRR